jgi:hypothetical protein
MKKEIKKGTVKKTDTELLLLAGSKITTLTLDGEVIEYVLASDTSVVLEHDARLFPTR